MAKRTYQIPFDQNGNLIWKPARHHHAYASWSDNYKFTDTLKFLNFKVDRGTGCAYFKSYTDGRQYHMSLHDFGDLIEKDLFQHNVISGDFTFVKRGTSYFLVPILKKLNMP